jgi:hypothetical protein
VLCLVVAAPAAAADCSALNGTFSDESAERFEGAPRTLTEFAAARIRAKLFKSETPPAPQGLAGSGVRQRPKVTRLAQSVRITAKGDQVTVSYLDAAGNVLAQSPINASPAPWRCVSGRLERHYQTIGGLGERVRTERTEQALFAAAGGDLSFVESTTVKEAPAVPARRVEARFKRLAPR